MESENDFSQKIAEYTPSEQALDAVRQVPLLLAVGITGAGKDTVLQRLIRTHPQQYKFMISHTTRKPRNNDGVMEHDGAPYYFIDRPAANKMLDSQAYIEANYFAANLYASSISEIEKAGEEGKILISDIDVNGVGNYMRLGMNAKPVFLLPPSYSVWQARLQRRHAQAAVDLQDLRKRQLIALAELEKAIKHEYFYLVINDDIDKTVQLVDDIAHGKPVEPRYPKALEVAKQLAAEIAVELHQSPAAAA